MSEAFKGANYALPDGGGTAEEQLEELRGFCKVLLRELNWFADNIGPGNFSERGLAALADRIGAESGGDGVQMAAGQYTGNGGYGEADAVTLSFPFAPRLVIIQNKTGNEWGPLLIHAEVTKVHNKGDSSGDNLTVQWSGDGRTLKFWSSTSGGAQMNRTNTYNWTAIG